TKRRIQIDTKIGQTCRCPVDARYRRSRRNGEVNQFASASTKGRRFRFSYPGKSTREVFGIGKRNNPTHRHHCKRRVRSCAVATFRVCGARRSKWVRNSTHAERLG